MADYQAIRAGAGTRTAAIDEGLRAHMNKVYGTMSVGMLITFAAAWAISGLAVTNVPNAAQIGADRYLTELGVLLYTSPLRWVVMFAPLVFVFGFSAMINKMSAATAQTRVLRLRRDDGPVDQLDLPGLHGNVDRADLPDHVDRLRRPLALRLHDQEGPVRRWARSSSWA